MSKDSTPSAGALVGTAVRQLRKARDWTLEDLSGHTGISVTGLSQIETGAVKRVRTETVKRLASALKVPEDMLDPRRLAHRVEAEAQTLQQRQLVTAVLALDAELAEEGLAVLTELARRKRESPR